MSCVPTRVQIGDGTEDELTFRVKHSEPVFILRGQDRLAPDLIKRWGRYAQAHGAPKAKWQEALDIAKEFLNWTPRKFPD